MADAQEVFLPLQPGLITTYQGCGTDAIQRHRKGDQTGRKDKEVADRQSATRNLRVETGLGAWGPLSPLSIQL